MISLGGTTGGNTTNGIANTGSGSGINICPMNMDLRNSNVTGATGEIRYQLIGSEHVFQWKDASRWNSDATERFSFQARLNATTGTITFVCFINSVANTTTYQPVVGIRTATTAGNWQNRKVTAAGTETWATSLAGTTTGDNLRFTTATPNPKEPVSGQVYVYTPPTPPPSCTGATFPAVAAATATPASVCVTGDVTLWSCRYHAERIGSQLPVAVEHQRNRSLDQSGYDLRPKLCLATGVNSSRYFRCQVFCNASTTAVWTSSASSQVIANNPGSPTAINGTRCGPGTVSLAVTPPAGTTVNWYTCGYRRCTRWYRQYFYDYLPYCKYNVLRNGERRRLSSSYTGKPPPVSTNGNGGFSDVGLMFDAIQSFTW